VREEGERCAKELRGSEKRGRKGERGGRERGEKSKKGVRRGSGMWGGKSGEEGGSEDRGGWRIWRGNLLRVLSR